MTSPPTSRPPLEVWAGPECTVRRVENAYSDQLERTGHAERLDDLDRFAALGIKAIRYPVLWERTAPGGAASADWRWPDERLARLRELGLHPIVGLIHHGSGPPQTNLLDPAFPELLAQYARAVARRYPWVLDWTPVNEPLTTARFSCLYGHWFPHRRDDLAFARALLTQCRAVVMAMRAIREAIPDARLVQTEDLGKTHAVARLAYQAELENERRWLTWDLLCGELHPRRPMWRWLRRVGVETCELDWFMRNPCPPDVIGVNHYLSGERFLDDRVDRYPAETHGGNGRDDYADVLAARVLGAGPDGPAALVMETWKRYERPVAITEAHNGCTREEQLRWLDEVWLGAQSARILGADVRAVTVWSLLGCVDWATLLVAERGLYEPGVFDVRAPKPRRSALARMTRSLAETGTYDHPVLRVPGWWRRPQRLWYPPVGACLDESWSRRSSKPLLITGARGTLGRAFARICAGRGLPYVVLERRQLDIAEPSSVARGLDQIGPWAVINAAGYVRVDDAELDERRCRRDNAAGPAVLADACSSRGLPLVTFSSDLVFDGAQAVPYVESDSVAPGSAYGRSKAEGEDLVARLHPAALIVRTSAFFGPWDAHNFVTLALELLADGRPVRAADDLWVTPTYVPHLAHASLDLLLDGERGLWHVANTGAVTWAELARRAAELAGVDGSLVEPCSAADLGLIAPRPRYSALASERGWIMPALDEALGSYLADVEREKATAPVTA